MPATAPSKPAREAKKADRAAPSRRASGHRTLGRGSFGMVATVETDESGDYCSVLPS